MQYQDLIIAMNEAGCYNLADYKRVSTAFSFAEHVHSTGKPRKSGEPYITHPVAVAVELARMSADVDTICAGLLHDTVEDIPGITDQLIEEQFGPVVARLVNGVTKIRRNDGEDKEANREANLKKIVESITVDIRIVIIKLADRLHNMKTMGFMPPEKQVAKSLETLELYVPLANLLGEYRIKTELEDLAFKYINPKDYTEMFEITKKLERTKQHNKDIILVSATKALLDMGQIPVLDAKIKNLYGIYRRKLKYGDINNIHDLIAIKILLNDIKDCFMLEEHLTNIFDKVPGKSKNYIISPKTNGYMALHSSVYAFDGSMMQLQFMTPKMDKINQSGITASFQEMRENNTALTSHDLQQRVENMQFYKALEEFRNAGLTPQEYSKAVRQDVLTKMIYVEDKSRQVVELPYGSTPIDFAIINHPYEIDKIWKILVNGKVVSPDYKLESKDLVKIISNQAGGEAIPMETIEQNATTYRSKMRLRKINK